tara:strand:- start:651 stop:1064 length:414 start_codon:yes stop_codon:yes gene_type:complete
MMYNPAGFDPQGLDMNADLGDPRRQEKLPGGYATQGQAVSAPYAEANMKAAEKTNPMNAVSQEPGKDFLASYLQKGGMEQGETAFNPFKFFGGQAVEQGEKARQGELMEEPDTGLGTANQMLRYRQRQMEMMKQLGI